MSEINNINNLDGVMGTHGEFMLSIVDNPHSPFTEFDKWYQFDITHGYHTASFLDRIVSTSTELSEASQALALEQAMYDIVAENVLGLWIKVKESDFAVASEDDSEVA